MQTPKALQAEDLTVVIDSKEQTPLSFHKMRSITKALPTGDYTLLGLENEIAIERKSMQDLLMCVGRERIRFDKEIQRLLAYKSRLLLIEASQAQLESGNYGKSKVHRNAVIGSLLGWQALGLPIMYAGTHDHASSLAAWFLYICAKRRYGELKSFFEGIKGQS